MLDVQIAGSNPQLSTRHRGQLRRNPPTCCRRWTATSLSGSGQILTERPRRALLRGHAVLHERPGILVRSADRLPIRTARACRVHCDRRAASRNRYREAILLQLNISDHPLSAPNLRRLTREVSAPRQSTAPTVPVGRPIHARIHAAALSSSAGGDSATGSLELAAGSGVTLRAGPGCLRIPPKYAPVTFSLE